MKESQKLSQEAKREIITAAVFLVVGFLAGYITFSLTSSKSPGSLASAPAAGTEQPGGAGGGTAAGAAAGATRALPEGHPPVDTDTAIRMVQDEMAQNPKDPKPPLRLANFLYDQKHFAQSIEWYQKALALDPSDVDARTDMGTAYFNNGNPDAALEAYRKSLEINPHHTQTMFNLIIVEMEGKHDLAAARKAWARLHQQDPGYKGLDDLKQRLDAAQSSPAGEAN
jgi:cytochrome c-type biogenesis protein CcmH/NrfG